MNIAIFTDAYLPIKNGVTTSVNQLKNHLRNAGHTVVIVTVSVPHYIDEEPDIYRASSVPAGINKNDRFAGLVNTKKVRQFLKPYNIELIHIHSEFSMGYAGRRVAKQLNIPWIGTAHTMWSDYGHYLGPFEWMAQFFMRFLKYFYKTAAAITTPSIKSKLFFEKALNKQNIHIVPNGIDSKNFLAHRTPNEDLQYLKEELGILAHEKVIVYVGRVEPEKRVQELLDLYIQLLQKHDDIKILFLGSGSEVESLKLKAQKNGIEDKITFIGFIDWQELYKYYSLGDLFVMVSLSETHSMTIIEASICGVPTIARRDGSIELLVDDGKSGYLCDTDEEVLEKIEQTLYDEALLESFGAKALEIAHHYSVENHVKLMLEVYNEVLNKDARA